MLRTIALYHKMKFKVLIGITRKSQYLLAVYGTKKGVASYVIVSDDANHSKVPSWLFLKMIVADIRISENVEHLFIFSDNCTAQFKSKYTAMNICFLADDLGVTEVEWNTFAPGHGKGSVDAIGGQVKRQVWNFVKARTAQVNTASEFYECALKLCKTVNVLFVSQNDIEATAAFLNERWENARHIVGIRNFHHFRKCDSSHIFAGLTSTSVVNRIQVQSECEKASARPVTSCVRRLRYGDVYSESDSETDVLPPDEESQSESSTASLKVANEHQCPMPSDIKPRTYVLVKFQVENRPIFYKYAGVCQTVCENNEVRVVFLKQWRKNRKFFKIDDSDEKYIHFKQIEQILMAPKLKIVKRHMVYEFPAAVDVKEK